MVSIEYCDLEFGKSLGAGGSAMVYQGRWKSRNMAVAIKTSAQGIPNSELEVMRLVNHPNLLCFYGTVVQPPIFCIVTEYVEQGALFDFLHRNGFNSDRNLMWARQIAAGMKYLHFDVPDRVVIHGDLKSKNVLVSADNTVKICDFGSSKLRDHLPGISIHTTTKVLGTPRWMAPEVLENKPISKQCDVYSYGIVVWELLTHKIPFEEVTDLLQICQRVAANKERPPIPENCLPGLANLLRRFWDHNPRLRPEFTDVVSEMEQLPRMIVTKELPSQLQSSSQMLGVETEHLEVPRQRPVPMPRIPKPVPRPRNAQGGSLATPSIPSPRSGSPQPKQNDASVKQEVCSETRSIKDDDESFEVDHRARSNAMLGVPRPRSITDSTNGEVKLSVTSPSPEEYTPSGEDDLESESEADFVYDNPQPLSFQSELSAETSSPQPVQDVHPIWAISREEVELLDDELGKGAWGIVTKAWFRGEIVAAKRIHEALSKENPEFLYNAVRRELDIASNLRHPNLVLFLGAVIEGKLGELIILNELMDSSLRDVLAEGQLSRSQIKSFSIDIARALNYLHSCKPQPLIHRDVSSANVLLQRLGPDYWKAKLSDYGSLKAINLACTLAPGNPVYAAPEALHMGKQSCKMDTYSFGVLLIEMLSSKLPTLQLRPKLLQEIDWQEMRMLIETCIRAYPDERPEMQQIISSLEHLAEKRPARQLISNYVEMRWFVPSITRLEAENKLATEGKEGNFLVRRSTTKGCKYSLSVFHNGRVLHYRIWQSQSGEFYIDDIVHFQSLEEMIEFYKKSQSGLCTKLCEYLPGSLNHQSSLTDKVWEIPKAELTCGSEIAKGQCGYVVAGVWKGFGVAIRVTKQDILDETGLQFIRDAIDILKEFHHENVVKFHGICTLEGPLFIVTELMPRGSLDKYIKQHQELLDKKDVLLDMVTQICSALKFLENRGIIHGDLAARNCQVGERNVVKVADYSLALYTSPRKPSRTVVSIRWAAPELIVQQPMFTTKSDVWSFGVIMWELWSGAQTPYLDLRNQEVKGKLLAGHRLEKPGYCPDEVYTLMCTCWNLDAQQRPSFAHLHEEFCSLNAREEFGELQRPQSREPTTRKPTSTGRLYYEQLETPKSELILGTQLGNGGCGYMVAGTWRGMDVAIRVTKENAMNKDGLHFMEQAINILKEFQHEKLLKLYGICSQEQPVLYIITELLTNGPLNVYLSEHRVLVEKVEVLLDMATQVCSAMKFLESKQIVHTDVAAHNCLVGDRNVIKLADFSLPLFTSERTTSSSCVPIRWAAPEILKGYQPSIKSDIWSFGVLLWELWTAAQKPYSGLRNQQVAEKVIAGHRLEKPEHCPHQVYELMRSCWMADAEQRTSFVALYDGLKSLGAPDDIFGVVTGYTRPSKPAPKHSSIAVLYDSALEIPKSQLKFGRELACGKFGYVMSGEWEGTEVAIRVANDNALTEDGLEFIEEAVTAMKKFAHQNLLKLYGLCTREDALYVVTELVQQQGTLLNYIREQQELIGNQEVLIHLVIQICSAMEFLEANEIIHKDLAARNCLITENDVVKVTDFSLSMFISDRKPAKTCFPIKWSAPEVLKDGSVSTKSDVWSYGILLWEVWSGGLVPYTGLNLQKAAEQIMAGYHLVKPQLCSQEVYHLMQQCWQMKPEDRPSFVVLHGELAFLENTDTDIYEAQEQYGYMTVPLPLQAPPPLPSRESASPFRKQKNYFQVADERYEMEQEKEHKRQAKEQEKEEKKKEKEKKRKEEAYWRNKRKGLKAFKQFSLPNDVQSLFAVEILLAHPRTKNHLGVTEGEIVFVLLITHPKLPEGRYLAEKQDGTIGYLKKDITQRTAYKSAETVLQEPSPMQNYPNPEDIYERLPDDFVVEDEFESEEDEWED